MTGETSAATAHFSHPSHRLFALLVLAAILWHVPLEAQTVLVYDDKAAFLAATGAANATGPLPDIGAVAAVGATCLRFDHSRGRHPDGHGRSQRAVV
jgi:hypothetical protein